MKKDINSSFYNQVWRGGGIQKPTLRSTWEVVKEFEGERCLEIGCGNSPIVPLSNSYFLDISSAAVNNLKSAGLRAYLGSADKIPFKNGFFKLVVAWHILEHVSDDKKALLEIGRVLKDGGYFLFAGPIWQKKWTKIDKIVGHKRRYNPKELGKLLKKDGFKIIKHRSARSSQHLLRLNFLTPFLVKVYECFSRQNSSVFSQKAINLWARLNLISERLASADWKDGDPGDVGNSENLALFCRKKV